MVYVVYVDESFDLDQSSYILGVYNNVNLAREVKNNYANNIKENCDYNTIEEDENYFETYNDGTYAENHYCIYVVAQEVKGEN